MAGVMPHTDKALNPVAADQTVEAELATLVSEYLQFHRCTQAYEVREEPRARGARHRAALAHLDFAPCSFVASSRLSRPPLASRPVPRVAGTIVAAAC